MKIGVCARSWQETGGIGVYTRSVVEALLRIDQSNEYHLLLKPDSGVSSEAGCTDKGAGRVLEVDLRAKGKLLWDQWAVPRYAARNNLDVVWHTKFAVPFLSTCETAMVLHGTERFVHPEFHQTADLWFFKTVYMQYLKRASLILAVSERAREDVIEFAGIDPKKVFVTYLAADPVFRVIRSVQELDSVKTKYKLPDRFVLFAGHIYPGKNFGRLLNAFSMVCNSLEIDLVVAGGLRWKYEDDLAAIERLGLGARVHFAGHVPQQDLAVFYNLALAAVFPSHYESFGLINIEAQACGCPLVTSRTGGSPEAAGEAAVYVDPLKEVEIADSLERVVSDEELRFRLVKSGLENVKRFSWERTARETLNALEWAVST